MTASYARRRDRFDRWLDGSDALPDMWSYISSAGEGGAGGEGDKLKSSWERSLAERED